MQNAKCNAALIQVQRNSSKKKKMEIDDDGHLGESKDKDDCHGAIEKNPSDPCHCLEKPVADVWHNPWKAKDITLMDEWLEYPATAPGGMKISLDIHFKCSAWEKQSEILNFKY